jgi:hypothetical protein
MGLYSNKLWASVKVIDDYNDSIVSASCPEGVSHAEHMKTPEVRKRMVDAGKFVGKLQVYGGLADELLRQCTWEDLENCGLPRLLSRKVAKIFRSNHVDKDLLPSPKEKDVYRSAAEGNPSWQSKGDTGRPRKKRPGIL